MNSPVSYLLPLVLAVAFHALVAFGLVARWDEAPSLEVTEIERYYIEASLVSENPHKARERRETEQKKAAQQARNERVEKQRQAANRRAKLDQEQLDKARRDKETAAKAEADRLARLAAEQAAMQEEPPPSEEDAVSEAERVRMEQNLALAILDEQAYRRAVTDDERAMAYVGQIQREIVQNWSRPPSARNGMQALLKVRLVPTGEVVDVAVLESSGNDSFDRSAILAVEKAERFEVPGDSRQFERNFREFEVLFRPEDLRL